jgi:uncharacterized protein DUF4145
MPSVYENVDYPHVDEHQWLTYTCPWCSKVVSGAIVASAPSTDGSTLWMRCSSCLEGALIKEVGPFGHDVYPPMPFGPDVIGLPQDVKRAYYEARRCIGVGAYTAAELMCRKILMHVGVDKGAKEGQKFAAYLTYLESHGYVTPPMKGWVELIKDHGNAATHELPSTTRQRAESTLMFTAELLRLVYEMEHMAQRYAKPSTPHSGDASPP